jgi:hypothetical protein
MSTKDQTFSSMLHGEAKVRAKRPELAHLVAELRELTGDRYDLRTECAGIIAGSWFARPVIMGADLIAAGLLINAGPTDIDLLRRWLTIGFARRGGMLMTSDPDWNAGNLT